MIKFDKSLYYYDEAAANFVIEFVEEFCTHVRGDKAGEPLLLADFWKEDIIKPVFGIKKRANHKRRFKTVYIEIGKGNAKSTVGSALALYLLGFDGSKGASVYSIATDTEQARIIFDNAKFMIEQSPYLKQYFEPFMYSIVKKGTPCSYKVLSGDAKGKHGLIPTAIIFDEVHEQRDRELWDTITAGQMKIDDSLTLAFTTAGWDKQTICYELHKKAIEIESGIITDDSFYGKIYTAPEKDDIGDVKTWKKANPGLGTIISVENMAIEYGKVKASPGYENTFRRLHLNQWTSVYESWISDTEWMENMNDLNRSTDGMNWFGGTDLSATRDLSSVVYICPIYKDGMRFITKSINNEGKAVFDINYDAIIEIRVKTFNWCPKDKIDKRIENNIDWRQWVKKGYIKETPGESIDHNVIINDLREDAKNRIIIANGYDRRFSAPIIMALSSEINMHAFDQSITEISYPTKTLNDLSAKRLLNHEGDPVLRWYMNNVKIYRNPNDDIKIIKNKSTEKVDGAVSLVMAIGEWLTYEMSQQGESVYKTRGVYVIEDL